MLGLIVELAVGAGLELGLQAYLKDKVVPVAVSIAQHQGWVSPHRLARQTGISVRDARSVLLWACKSDMLYLAVNGRYYLKQNEPVQRVEPVRVIESTWTAPTNQIVNDIKKSDNTGAVWLLVSIVTVAAIFVVIPLLSRPKVPASTSDFASAAAALPTADVPAVINTPVPVVTPVSLDPIVTASVVTTTPAKTPPHKHAKHKNLAPRSPQPSPQ